MTLPESPYIDQADGACRIARTRVGLHTIVAHFQEGRSPEQIVESFPKVTVAQTYGAIVYYLENKELIDAYIAQVEREFERRVRPLSEQNPAVFAGLEEARRQMTLKRS